MIRQLTYVIPVVAITGGWALAQSQPQPQPQQQPPGAVAPCPSIKEQKQAANKRSPDKGEPPAAQPAERSAILPEVGGEKQSAAPTVQQDGKEMRSPIDCAMVPQHPNAPPKGSKG
jgi:hypothetical protein